jgi:multicomponent Na+:H+ antiporter subunit D
METTLILNTHWNIIFCSAFAALAVAIFLYARFIPQGDGKWWALAGLVVALTLAGSISGAGLVGTLLIDAAAFAVAALIFVDQNPDTHRAAQVYLAVVLIAVVCLIAGERLAGDASNAPAAPIAQIVTCLLVAGFTLKLALVPLYFWLPSIAENAAPMSVALVVSVVDIAAFNELAHFRQSMPWIFTNHQGVWLLIALLSMFGGALLALGQKNIRRMLAFSTIDDMGYLLLGVLYGNEIGLTGALLGALAHAIFKVVLFGAVGVAENGLKRPLTLDEHGLAGRFPKAGAAFIAASLGMIGVPPFIGFAGRWRLYLSGVELGGIWLGMAMALATVIALFYYVRAIHRVWMGSNNSLAETPAESVGAATILIILVVAAIVLGLVPAWLLSL